MNPYRPLHVCRDEPEERPDAELRGMAILLVVLGILRFLPIVAGKQGNATEVAIAFVMLFAGVFELFEVRRRIRRWRTRCALRR